MFYSWSAHSQKMWSDLESSIKSKKVIIIVLCLQYLCFLWLILDLINALDKRSVVTLNQVYGLKIKVIADLCKINDAMRPFFIQWHCQAHISPKEYKSEFKVKVDLLCICSLLSVLFVVLVNKVRFVWSKFLSKKLTSKHPNISIQRLGPFSWSQSGHHLHNV